MPQLDPVHVRRLEEFLERIAADVYPEPPSSLHNQLIPQVVNAVFTAAPLPPGASILDVGCGQGVAMKLFVERGHKPVGIALGQVDVDACVAMGLDVRRMDQSFLDFPDASFDMVWCRHCLEHSIFPHFTLAGFHRVTRPGGLLYLEVPAPDTGAGHQTNRNHYSVLTKSMWHSLATRHGFEFVGHQDLSFTLASGVPDLYFSLLYRKPA